MAKYTQLSVENASEVLRAHGRGPCLEVEALSAGSVNSNFFVRDAQGRLFLRIYEEQTDVAGLAYELGLLAHLHAQGIPVPQPLSGPAPGALRVAGKFVGVFEAVQGEELCSKLVNEKHLRALGATLARIHLAGRSFEQRRRGRFELTDLSARIEKARLSNKAELGPVLAELDQEIEKCASSMTTLTLPQGAIHGDLFRDNVKWRDSQIGALIDWESASHGVLAYDLMVVVLAWCFADRFEWQRAKSLLDSYRSVRELNQHEWLALRRLGIQAALRFTVTRITDYFLRADLHAAGGGRDYRRFLSRLHELQKLSDEEVQARLR